MNSLFNITTLRVAAAAGVTCLALLGCGGGGGNGVYPPAPVDTTRIPNSAIASVGAFISYLQALAPSDTAEPLNVTDVVPPTDDTAEPLPVA